MPVERILNLTGGALRGALPVFLIYLLLRLVWLLCARKKDKADWRRELLLGALAFYLPCLLHITVWRSGADWGALSGWLERAGRINWAPIVGLLPVWRASPGELIYNVAGNLIWFVPLGFLWAALRPKSRLLTAALAGGAVSAAIELMQLVLGTGVTDVDDLLLNTLGAAGGWLLYRLLRLILEKRREGAAGAGRRRAAGPRSVRK